MTKFQKDVYYNKLYPGITLNRTVSNEFGYT